MSIDVRAFKCGALYHNRSRNTEWIFISFTVVVVACGSPNVSNNIATYHFAVRTIFGYFRFHFFSLYSMIMMMMKCVSCELLLVSKYTNPQQKDEEELTAVRLFY